jgi:NosR/NirI family nitrous oxide reductase transcriptional regulator
MGWPTYVTWLTGLAGAVMLLAVEPAAVGETRAAMQVVTELSELNEEDYHEVLPDAVGFESIDGSYLHVRGYLTDASGRDELVGFVFLVKDLGARARGYNGVIPILVGMDMRGRVTGIKIFKHYEPYGYRSINLPEYRAQFEGKSVLDPFEVGDDIDAYSGATITTVAATRAVRHASRRMAREFLVKKNESQAKPE